MKIIKTKKFYTIAELANMYYLVLTSYKNAQTAAEKYYEDDDFIVEFAKYTESKFNEVIELIKSFDIELEDILDYIGGISEEDGNKKIYVKKGE